MTTPGVDQAQLLHVSHSLGKERTRYLRRARMPDSVPTGALILSFNPYSDYILYVVASLTNEESQAQRYSVICPKSLQISSKRPKCLEFKATSSSTFHTAALERWRALTPLPYKASYQETGTWLPKKPRKTSDVSHFFNMKSQLHDASMSLTSPNDCQQQGQGRASKFKDTYLYLHSQIYVKLFYLNIH